MEKMRNKVSFSFIAMLLLSYLEKFTAAHTESKLETLGCSCSLVQYKECMRGFCVAVRALRIMYFGFRRDLSGPLGMSGISHRKPCGCNRTFSTAFLHPHDCEIARGSLLGKPRVP